MAYKQFVIDEWLLNTAPTENTEFESLIVCIWKSNTRQTSFQTWESFLRIIF